MQKNLRLSTYALASLTGAGAIFLPSASSQSGPSPFAARFCEPNVIGNGGFELWGYGVDGTTPPEQWLPMGDPANTFNNQQFLIINRVPGDADCSRDMGGGDSAVELHALQDGNFLSQRLENPTEWRCKTVTLTARFMTPYNVASPTITIDDGVSSSSDTRQLVVGQWRLFSVTHKVSENATKVEVKLDPDTISIVDDVQLVCGDQPNAPYVPRANPEPGLMQLPLGCIIDWYQLDPRIEVPEGFVVCDGQIIQDPASPFFGLPTLNLADKFVRGVTSEGAIGSTGGTDSVNFTHSHTGTTGDNQSPGDDYWYMSQQQWNTLHNAKDPHTHSFSTNNALGTISIVPSYVGLLKIMRIK